MAYARNQSLLSMVSAGIYRTGALWVQGVLDAAHPARAIKNQTDTEDTAYFLTFSATNRADFVRYSVAVK